TYKRQLYTGSIFIMNDRFLESSVAIRTGIIQDNRLFVNSGGAITIDSDPVDEYEETLHKIKNFLNVIKES
ncbi:MAG: hypothetical protein B6226_04570, partial [Candidatus Cloacimonetes bacterium 4572_65]